MEGYWQQQSTSGLDWNLQQLQTYQSLANANEVLSGIYKRRASRVTKPISAGNSPHSLARRRTMMAHSPAQYQQYPADTALLGTSLRRKSRPMSWHPSSKHASYPHYMMTSYPSCMDYGACKQLGHQQQQQPTEAFSTASIYGLATPVSHLTTADSISNLYFSPLDASYGTPVSQAFTSSETTNMMQMDSFSWPASTLDNACLPSQLYGDWVQDALSADCPLPTSQIADLGQESVPSSDEFTAPPTPDVFPTQFKNTLEPQSEPTKSQTQDDELIGMGLYDEPETISMENSLLGGSNTNRETAGKGLKLEETFSPSPDNDEDDEEEGKEDDTQEQEDESQDNAVLAGET
ncbi:hypothetical protein VTN96DRAFT_6268 [Rasamsonia emersonii]